MGGMFVGRSFGAKEHEERDPEGDEGDDEIFVRREFSAIENDLSTRFMVISEGAPTY